MSKKEKGKQKLLSKEEYKSKTKLSQGPFCKIYKIVEDTTYVVKKYDIGYLKRGDEEYRTLNALKHCDNIVELKDKPLVKDKTTLQFSEEYCELGSLYDMLVTLPRSLEESEVRAIFFQIVKGLHQVHSKGYIHRNLTISHILIKANGNVKLSGFSLAKLKPEAFQSVFEIDKLSDYMPPQLKPDEPIVLGMKTDIYSLGIILYELVLKECPSRLLMNNNQFENSDDENKAKSIDMSYSKLSYKCSTDLCDLYENMVCKNEIIRADMSDIFTHPWMKVFSKESIDKILEPAINDCLSERKKINDPAKDYFISAIVKNTDKLHQLLSKVYYGKCAENESTHILYGSRTGLFLHIKLKKPFDGSDNMLAIIRGNIHCFKIKEDLAK
jgi:serine/threonine protein kinase